MRRHKSILANNNNRFSTKEERGMRGEEERSSVVSEFFGCMHWGGTNVHTHTESERPIWVLSYPSETEACAGHKAATSKPRTQLHRVTSLSLSFVPPHPPQYAVKTNTILNWNLISMTSFTVNIKREAICYDIKQSSEKHRSLSHVRKQGYVSYYIINWRCHNNYYTLPLLLLQPNMTQM